MDLPILYKKDKAGKIRYREYKIEGDTYYVRAGLLKTRETHEWKPHKRAAQFDPSHGSHKTAEEVALQHAKSDWVVAKREQLMYEDLDKLISGHEEYPIPIAPVLAMKYKDLEKRHSNPNSKYKFPDRPFIWTEKADGERCLCGFWPEWDDDGNTFGEKEVRFSTRSRNPIPYVEHLKSIMTKVYDSFGKKNPQFYSYVFDGEIIQPGKSRNSMRSSISTVLKKHQDNAELTYYVFDLILTNKPDEPHYKRLEILKKIFDKVNSKYVKLMPILGEAKLDDPKVDEFMAMALDRKAEGIVGRDPNMIYPTAGHRLETMVKKKNQETYEAEIYDCYCGQDLHQDLIMFRCRWPDKPYVTFDITPAWSHDDRKEAYYLFQNNPSEFIGKYLTIVCRDLSEYGVPVEGRGVCIRETFDMDKEPVVKNNKRYKSNKSGYNSEDD